MPVAAPWYGSMAEGWLWLSMRKATAMPSPASTTPAFSPGPDEHPGPSVGSRRRCSRLDLYEQCSDHITAYMASSRWLGVRPRMRSMAAASSSVSPRARWIGSSSGTAQHRVGDKATGTLASATIRRQRRSMGGMALQPANGAMNQSEICFRHAPVNPQANPHEQRAQGGPGRRSGARA